MQRNDRRVIRDGIEKRYERARKRQQWWKAEQLYAHVKTQWAITALLLLLALPCHASSHRARSTIDPGGSAPHADTDPYGEDKPRLNIVSHIVIPATATMPSDCTKDSCGKPAIEDKK